MAETTHLKDRDYVAHKGHSDDVEVRALSLHLLQNSLIYVNTLTLQHLLNQAPWSQHMTQADWRGLTPLFYTGLCTSQFCWMI